MASRGTWRRRLARVATTAVLSLLGAYLVVFVVVQLDVHRTRRHAEQLFTEMSSIHPGKTTWNDLEGLRSRWGKTGTNVCSENGCDYTVEVSDLRDSRSGFLRMLATVGHDRGAGAFMRMSMQNSVVEKVDFELWTEVPEGYGSRRDQKRTGPYLLMARLSLSPELPPMCCYWPKPVPHPDYVVSKPARCMICLSISIDFQPESLSLAAEAAKINFDCMTRWRACTDEEDIMPAAAREIEEDSKRRWPHCDYGLEEYAERSLHAAVVQIDEESADRINARLIRDLGPPSTWREGSLREILADADDPVLTKVAATRQRLIVLFPVDDPSHETVSPYPCGLQSYSEANAALVAQAISRGKGLPLN